MSILVTGAAGFIGSAFVRQYVKTTNQPVIALDALTYAGNMDNLAELDTDMYTFCHVNICDQGALNHVFESHAINTVIHFAAESHVDRSILGSDPFIQTNIVGTQRLLDASRLHKVSRFIHVSTDEVYGTLQADDDAFTEAHPIKPNSPYAASKASSDLLVRSYIETFGFPAMITRCSNNYGPYQFPEKLIPLMIHRAKSGDSLPVYGNGKNIRDWVHVDDHCRAIMAVLNQGSIGSIYNIGGNCERTNIRIVEDILDILGQSKDLIKYVTDRPGHDFRYAMNIQKIKDTLGWVPEVSFEDGLKQTVEWYQKNTEWIQRVISGEYKQYIKEQYQ